MPLQIDLTDRQAIVTGVTSGIGVGIARQLAIAGCDICGCGTRGEDSPEAKAFVELVGQHGRHAHYRAVDLTDAGATRAFVRWSAERLGGIDIVISNAGRNVFKGAEHCSDAEWQQCMELDLASHWRLAQAAKPYLEQGRDPVIIINGSNHAFSTMPGCFPYNVAKAGLVAMAQSLAIEWGPKIRAITIAPGYIDTPGNDAWFNSFEDPQAARRRTERLHPVGRIGTVDEIGAWCAFLASPYAGFVTGMTILIDGGRSALMQDA